MKGDAALRRRRRPVRLPLGRRFLRGSLAAAGVLLRAQLRDARRRVLPERRRAKRRAVSALSVAPGLSNPSKVASAIALYDSAIASNAPGLDTLHTSIRAFAGPLPRIESLNAANVAAGIHVLAVDVSGANSTPRRHDLAGVILFDDHLAPPDRRGIQTLQRHRHRELPVVIVGGLDVDEGLGYGRDGDGGDGRDSSVERVVFGHQRGALVGRERRRDGELDGRARRAWGSWA